MIAKQLISESIIPLKTSDTGSTALSMMDDYRISHLPIVDNVDFLGLISDVDIYNLNNFDEPLGNFALSLPKPYVIEYDHFYEVVKLISYLKLTLVPVLDNNNKYMGSITLNILVKNFSKIAAINNPGGIIVLDINNNDYSLTEIAQIVESNGAKVLSLYVTSHPDSTKIEVTLKINKIDILPVLQTFNRYNYIVKASYSEKENLDDLRERFESLMNYLNI
ncbi:MAG: CBS domain-containing protein [Bacteroidetes bacterium]|jgi:CBS domain-containing protein|nr:CBS domain-containing protein [Bacteroidota bacterium]MCK4360180.1 CBS domain-containing protein [Bacteroidales bacterium]MCK4638907.1 CBS domain-containing protein [Bacteroidales bacterium]